MKLENKLKEIQILLFTLPCTNNKEYNAIIKGYEKDLSVESLTVLFEKLFSISKYTNTDVYHILSVFSKFIESVGPAVLSPLSQKVRSLKFFPSEKDTELVIYKYFEVINRMSESMGEEELQDVYSRYVFLQSKEIVNNVMIHFIYGKFKEFLVLHPLFLRYTIEKGVYKEMLLKNEFLMDFYEQFSRVVLIDSSFDTRLGMRIFIINNTRNKYLLQEFFSDIPPWYMKSLTGSVLPFLYFNFDVYGIYRELGLEYANSLDIETFTELAREDLRGDSKRSINSKVCDIGDKEMCDIGDSKVCDIGDKEMCVTEDKKTLPLDSPLFLSEDVTNLRKHLKEFITLFNKTLDMDPLLNTFGQIETMMLLRISKTTSLKALGEFLCKAKNESFLKIFTGTFDFHDLTLIEALRVYLGSFYLVGESQVIHRVLTTFSEKYFIDNVKKNSFMELVDDEKTRKFLFNFSFSLLVLNTKMYNPNIKVKPTFKSHMEDFTEEEIPTGFSLEYLQSQFESVSENKMELAVRNKAGRHHFVVYERICKTYGIPQEYKEIRSVVSDSVDVGSDSVDVDCNKDLSPTLHSLLAYKDLLSKVISNFFDTPPEKFYSLCEIVGEKKYIERYLKENKRDTHKFLCMFKYYTPLEGDIEVYRMFVQVLKRIEKPRTSVFSKSTRETVLSQYKKSFNEIVESRFKDIHLLVEALRDTTNSFVLSLSTEILERNLEGLRDVSPLPDTKISLLLDKTISTGNRHKFIELSSSMSPEGLLAYYKNMLETVPRFLNFEICESFKGIGIYNEDAFSIVLNLQKEFDLFEWTVEIKEEKIECRGVNSFLEESVTLFKEEMFTRDGIDNIGDKDDNRREDGIDRDKDHCTIEDKPKDNTIMSNPTLPLHNPLPPSLLFKIEASKDILSVFSYKEKFEDLLRSPTNLFHFYASSKSILNQSKAKTIHKTGCPLGQDLFSPKEITPRLIYLLKKADTLNNKDVSNYSLWIVNLISSSLPLFSTFFRDNFGLLLTVNNLVKPIVKIFCSRLGKTLTGNALCCKCGYSKLGVVEDLMKMLVKYDLASVEDFDFYFKVRNEKINTEEIRIEDGELYWEVKGRDVE